MNHRETLYLVPSQVELDYCHELRMNELDQVELCGVGVVVSAARTVQLLNQHQPRRVVLLGIAGAYAGRAAVEDVFDFGTVSLWGIGAGEENSLKTLSAFGLKSLVPGFPEITDTIELNSSQKVDLLTVCNAAGNPKHAMLRAEQFPTAVAEEMEGYSVALACKLANVPLKIVRGISNIAGDRNHSNWKIERAMFQCVGLINEQFVSQSVPN